DGMILSALRNGVRGALATTVVYPLVDRLEQRDIRTKAAWVVKEIDRPYAQQRASAWARRVEHARFAGASVPYYRDLFAQVGFDRGRLRDDPPYLDALPYLTEDIIREQGTRLLREDHAGMRMHVAKTGGSTGPSAHIYYDQEAA